MIGPTCRPRRKSRELFGLTVAGLYEEQFDDVQLRDASTRQNATEHSLSYGNDFSRSVLSERQSPRAGEHGFPINRLVS